jgi:RHS repeat-associated protein
VARPGDLISVRDADHQGGGATADETNSTRFEYDPASGYRSAVLQPKTDEAASGGNKTTYHFDVVGRPEWTVAPKGNKPGANADDFRTTFGTNAYGDVVQITDPNSAVSKRSFDANHNLEWSQPADGNCSSTPTVKCTTYTYDLADQLLSTNRPVAGTEQANTYWPDGSLETQTEGGVVTSYVYDTAGRLKSTTAPKPTPADADRVTVNGYDAYGRLLTKQDPGGNCAATPTVGCTTYGYDDASQPITVDYSDPSTPDVGPITYSASGRQLSVPTAGGATTNYTWDSVGRMRSSEENGLTTAYEWSAAGLNTKIAYPGGSCSTPTRCVVNTFDNAGRMKAVTDWKGNVTTFAPDEHGNTKTIAYPGKTAANQTSDEFTFDRADQLTGIVYKKDTATIATETYGRLAAGQLSSDVQTGLAPPAEGNARNFGYDANDRLCWSADTAGTNPTCAAPPSGAKTWTSDNAGNVTKTAANLYMRPDGANQLCYSNDVFGDNSAACGAQASNTATTYQYDNRGNRTGKTPPPYDSVASSYAYDQANRLTQVVVPTSAWNEGEYTALAAPVRIADTRSSSGGPCPPTTGCQIVPAGGTIEVPVGGTGGVPTSSVSAVAIDLGVTGGTGEGFLTAYAGDAALPGTSNLNFGSNQTLTNGAIVKVGANNKIRVTNSGPGSVHVIVDVQGWFSTWSGAAGGTFKPINPQRATSPVTITVGANSTQDVTVTNIGNSADPESYIPSTGVAAVTTNLTVTGVQAGGEGQLVAYSTGIDSPPATTNVAFSPGQTIAALSIVKVGADGKIRLHNRSGYQISVVVDLFGWTATTASNALSDFVTTTPTRIPSQGQDAGETRTVQITGVASIPANATAVSATITAYGAAGDGYLQAWANGGPAPQASVLNYTTSPVANGIIVKIGNDGKINIKANTSTTNVIIDVTGYYQPSARATSYTYNADGTRRTRDIGGTAAAFHWSHHQGLPMLLTETNVGGATFDVLYGPGGLPFEQIIDNGDPIYLHHDQQGSTRLATDRNGTTIAKWTYDPYGSIIGAEGNYLATHMLYTGQYFDWETGFYYLRARFYDPTTASFLTRDPLVGATRSAYGYVYGNPLNLVDPSGLCGEGDIVGPVEPCSNPGVRDRCMERLGSIRGAFGCIDRRATAPSRPSFPEPECDPLLAGLGGSGARPSGTGWRPQMTVEQADNLATGVGVVGGALDGAVSGAVIGTFACAWTLVAWEVCSAVGAGVGAVIGGFGGYFISPADSISQGA